MEWDFGSGKESKMVPLLKLNRSQYGKVQSCKASTDLDVIEVSFTSLYDSLWRSGFHRASSGRKHHES